MILFLKKLFPKNLNVNVNRNYQSCICFRKYSTFKFIYNNDWMSIYIPYEYLYENYDSKMRKRIIEEATEYYNKFMTIRKKGIDDPVTGWIARNIVEYMDFFFF